MDLVVDDNPIHITPWLVLFIIALNTLVFLFMAVLPAAGQDSFINHFGTNGAQFSGHMNPDGQIPEWATLLTSAFLHGDFLHLFANMYVLFIFGDNIEYAFGRIRFFVFYIAACFFSGWLSVVMLPETDINGIGASGAVAAVLGAYFVLYPRAEVDYLLGYWDRPVWLYDITLRAWFVILSWLAVDFYFTITGVAVEKTLEHGIGYLAHVAGFVMGVVFGRVLRVHYTTGDIVRNNAADKRAQIRERGIARRRSKEWREDDSWRDN